MTDGQARRAVIVKALEQSQRPISASSFAREFGVSRQIVVGDIALLRASGAEIIATARGYLLEQEDAGFTAKVAVQHGPEQLTEELELIVDGGGEIVDVIVEHPLYGELRGGLHIKSRQDVTNFTAACEQQSAVLLSQLTSGIHLHTVRCADAQALEKIKQALAAAGILYQGV